MDFPLIPPDISYLAQITHLSTTWDTSDCFRLFYQTLSSQSIASAFDTTLTFFCPTREAFAYFNNEDYERLLYEPIWTRHATELLLNHMHPGAKTQQELVELTESGQDTITMLNGATYELSARFGVPRIQNGILETARVEFGDLVGVEG